MTYQHKKLTLSKENRVLAGVCGGIGEYFNVDPVFVRVMWIVFTVATVGAGVIAYLASWVIIPESPKEVEFSEGLPIEPIQKENHQETN